MKARLQLLLEEMITLELNAVTLGRIRLDDGSSVEAFRTLTNDGHWKEAIEVIDSQTFIHHAGNESTAYDLYQ
jgi:hypothetical protein